MITLFLSYKSEQGNANKTTNPPSVESVWSERLIALGKETKPSGFEQYSNGCWVSPQLPFLLLFKKEGNVTLDKDWVMV